MMFAVRYVLALVLALQFSGVSAAWAKPCTNGAMRGEHGCCLARQGGPVQHLSGTCGCQMTPMPAAPPPSTVYTSPDSPSSDHRAEMVAVLAMAGAQCEPDLAAVVHPPPLDPRDASLSRLSGSGFRC